MCFHDALSSLIAVLRRAEFMQLAERRSLNLNVAGGFHRTFATAFGIELNALNEPNTDGSN